VQAAVVQAENQRDTCANQQKGQNLSGFPAVRLWLRRAIHWTLSVFEAQQ
jgi:hypothetical protein